jgi:hypothetical protein
MKWRLSVFRVCTEDKNRDGIQAILDSRVDGYSLFAGIGCWKGQRELSLSIDLIGPDRETVYQIAELIKTLNAQESVLVLEIPVSATFI